MPKFSGLAAIAITALTLGFQAPAFAANGTHTARVYTLLWYEGHDGLLIRMEGMPDLGGCGNSNYYILRTDHLFFKEIYAMLLASHLADQNMKIDVNGCYQGYGSITHVQSTR